MMLDKYQDKCGLFGVYRDADAVSLTIRGLQALQHRGQECAGIAFSNGRDLVCTKVMGTVKDLSQAVQSADGIAAIGHVRYGTCGAGSLSNAQPFLSPSIKGDIALCHNGHIVNAAQLWTSLMGSDLESSTSDSGMLSRLVASCFTSDLPAALQAAFLGVSPAYSVLVLSAEGIGAVRDPLGMRPLSVGYRGNAAVFSSETCAFGAVDATFRRDICPGEMLVIQGDEEKSLTSHEAPIPAQCIFELIYFARPDSVMFGHSVAEFRIKLGARLAVEAPADGDIVVPVPDSAIYGALGFARTSGLELSMALFRDPQVGRTFIEPTQATRTTAVMAKFRSIRSLIYGRRVVLVDDSIVRGTTSRHLVRILREAGAREVHLRITSPPTIASCHFGVDTPNESELLGAACDTTTMRQVVGADSLAFLSLEGLLDNVKPMRGFCSGCFTGSYPIEVPRSHRPIRSAELVATQAHAGALIQQAQD